MTASSGAESVLQALQGVVTQAARQAEALPADLATAVEDAVQAAGDQAVELANSLRDQLIDLVSPPNWNELLLFLLLQLVPDPPGDFRVKGLPGSHGFGPAVAVAYEPTLGSPKCTIGLSLSGAGTHGLIIQLADGETTQFTAGPLTISVSAGAATVWWISFGGGPPVASTEQADLKITASLPAPVGPLGIEGLMASMGATTLTADLHAASAPPAPPVVTWHVSLALGESGVQGKRGLEIELDPAAMLGFDLPMVNLAIAQPACSPLVIAGTGHPVPVFDLRSES